MSFEPCRELLTFTVMKKLVVIVPMPGTFLLDLAGPCDVFGAADKALDGDGGYDILLASPLDTKHVMTKCGIEIVCPTTVTSITQPIDTLIIAGFTLSRLPEGTRFIQWLRDAYPHLQRVGSVCVGTYALAEAGILDGKHATTHWEHSQQFQQKYPQIMVDTNPFFTKDGNVYSSGGVSSGIDLSLALVEEDYGRHIAQRVARRLVLQLKRPGYQSQFSNLLEINSFENSIAGKLYPWMVRHLSDDLSIEQLAEHSSMSVRNFARVFLKETGLTPAKFVEKVRVEVARKYLEDSDLSMDQIAEKCGLGGLISMRRTFLRHMMVSPSEYRRSFRTSLHVMEE
jgi:transcriptional regulator GlxA family with amidase domain